jgi:O-antigen/teichoic acid export membrane protein
LFSTQSSSTKFGVILFSRIIATIIGIVFVPMYVKIIGVESYGLVAFYSTLSGSLIILDMGLSTAISRQVSILTTRPNGYKQTADLVLSVEVIYWVLSLLAGLTIILFASPIAQHWVKAKDLPIRTIWIAVMLMGGIFACSFPVGVYTGVMNSLNLQLPNAYIIIVGSLFKAVGVILALKYISSTIECYFIWQIAISLLVTITMRSYTWYILKKSIFTTKARFSIQQLQTIWKFAAGITGISLITFFLSQIDKIVVSKYVTLDFVGYYGLAYTVAGTVTQVITPLNPILFPKFTTLVAQNNQKELVTLYHKSCRWIGVIVLPIGFTLILFAHQILLLWTHNPAITKNTAPILQVFAAGSICNSFMWIPYWYMLSKGITKFTIYQNIIASVILVPLLFWWIDRYGALGASFVWLAVNAGYVFISIPIFHTLYLKGELKDWYIKDTLYPLFIVSLIAGTLKFLQVLYLPNIQLINLTALLFAACILYALLIPEIRSFLVERYKLLKSR